MADDEAKSSLTRRKLLKTAGTVAAGGAAAAAWYAAWRNSTYLFLMRKAPTESAHPPGVARVHRAQLSAARQPGIRMSDISFGGAGIDNPEVVARAVERGINYFDTSPDYSKTGSEQMIGKALKPHRDKVFIASKFCTADGHLPTDTPVADIIAPVEAQPDAACRPTTSTSASSTR